MAVREDLVASAAQFLQDPSVASSPTENKMAFLRQKNLTQEEIEAALARSGPAAYAPGPSLPCRQPYGSYAWQQAAPMPVEPRRDWRDWFIMATVISGVGYGLWSLGKRYVYPLIAPPTPERLEQDKRSIEEQFDRAFGLVEQLAKDTEALKAAEKLRAERLDTALTELDRAMSEVKSANRRGEDNSQRIREEVQSLKDAIPKALKGQKELTDSRLVEITSELGSLKTLISQRMTGGSAAGHPLRPSPAGAGGGGAGGGEGEKTVDGGGSAKPGEASNKGVMPGGTGRPPGLSGGSGGGGRGRASIPAWQMAAAGSGTESSAEGAAAESESGTKAEGTAASGRGAGAAAVP